MRPMNQRPEVLCRMVRYLRWDAETGRIIRIRFQETSHLDTILAHWTGMIGDRPSPQLAPPMTTIILHLPARSSESENPVEDLTEV
jgi:hypothetical protein